MIQGCEANQGLALFNRVLAHDPYSSDVLRAKTQLLVGLGREEEAIKTFQSIVMLWPNAPLVRNALGQSPSLPENQTPDGKEK